MAIEFPCSSCDVLLKVADSAAGKKCKCPKCGTMNLVPAAKEDVAEGEVEKPRKVQSKQAVTPEPPPRAKLKPKPVADEPDDVDEPVEDRTPRKGKGIAVEPPARVKPTRRPVAGEPDDIDSNDADDEVEQDEKPRKGKRKKAKAKKGRSRKGLMIGLAVALGLGFLACAGVAGGVAWWYFGGGGGPPDEFRYFPDRALIIHVDRVDQRINSAVFKEITAKLGEDKGLGSYEKLYGIPASNIDRVSTGTNRGGDNIIVVRTLSSVKASDITAKFKLLDANRSYTETTSGKHTIYEPKTAPAPGPFGLASAFCVVDSKTIVFGQASTLKTVLERNKEPTLSISMQAALKKADFKRSDTRVQDFTENLDMTMPGGGLGFGFGPSAKKFRLNSSVTLVDVGTDVTVHEIYTLSDPAQANDAKKEMDDTFEKAKDQPMFKDFIGEVQFRSWVSGNTVESEAKIPGKAFAKFIGGLK